MVKQVDREVELNVLTMALNLVGLMVTYEQVELINEVQKAIENKGTSFNIEDSVKMKINWGKKWSEYYEKD